MIKYSKDFIKTHRRETKNNSPILFFHSWVDGKVNYQGYIYQLKADGSGRAQLFDWIMGDLGDKISFTKAFLNDCTFYTTDHEMNRSYERWDSKKDLRKLKAV